MPPSRHPDRRQSLDAAQRAFCEHIASRLSGDAPSQGAVISDGEWHRFRVSGDKRGEESGTYKQYGDSPYNGLFRCHRRGITGKWSPKTDHEESSPAEREEYRKRVAQNERKRERKTEAAARRAQRIWAEAKPAPDAHQYFVRKRIKPHGIRVGADGRLIVPVYGQDGKLASLQFISATGKKLFLGGAAAGGGYYLIGEIDESTTKILVAEGFATGATLHEATGRPVVVAFNADNLLKVAPWLRKLHSGTLIVIGADDDRWKPEKGNPGLTKGRKAAGAIGAVLAVPDTTGIEGTPTDFNDVFIARGLDEVRQQIESAIEQESERARETGQDGRRAASRTPSCRAIVAAGLGDKLPPMPGARRIAEPVLTRAEIEERIQDQAPPQAPTSELAPYRNGGKPSCMGRTPYHVS
jgi:putative DNA primase/helicase